MMSDGAGAPMRRDFTLQTLSQLFVICGFGYGRDELVSVPALLHALRHPVPCVAPTDLRGASYRGLLLPHVSTIHYRRRLRPQQSWVSRNIGGLSWS